MSLLIFIAACLWDQLWGEVPNRLHPVVWMGSSIKAGEQLFLGRGASMERAGGILMAIGIPGLWAALVYGLLQISGGFVQILIACFFLKASFALKALLDAGVFLQQKLSEPVLSEARSELKSLCSRDASQLDRQELLEAGISSLAENLCDSVVAPLFYFLLGGVPAAIAYRAVNTLDAMIGYKNHFRYLGWASARLDDALNWIPARITAGLLLLAGALQRHAWGRAYSIAARDHVLTPSPNGGWPMATMAGLLGIRLRKPGSYELGHDLEHVKPESMDDAIALTRLAGFLSLGLCALLGAGVWI